LIYTFLIRLFGFALWIYGLFNDKIAKWNIARESHLAECDSKINQRDLNRRLIWFHVSSLGEYELAMPLIELVKTKTNYQILLTFFSPSGYNVIARMSNVDYIKYLPLDTKSAMNKMVTAYRPYIFIGFKYELWWNLFDVLSERKIDKHLIDLSIDKSHYLLNFPFKSYIEKLKSNTYVYLQKQENIGLLKDLGFSNLNKIGNLRIDRVIQRARNINPKISELKSKIGHNRIVIYGSVYANDLSLIMEGIRVLSDFVHVIVPHHVEKSNIDQLIQSLNPLGNIDKISGLNKSSRIIIVDKIGILFDLYSIAGLCYVGGGFNKNVHSVIEPLTFGIQIAIGPSHKGFEEIDELIELGVVKEVNNEQEFSTWVLKNKVRNLEIEDKSKSYLQIHTSTANSIFQMIFNQ
jgi:3-deoxy-D-manno-octulosonic-acid transferase